MRMQKGGQTFQKAAAVKCRREGENEKRKTIKRVQFWDGTGSSKIATKKSKPLA